jgi:hypothetical protein
LRLAYVSAVRLPKEILVLLVLLVVMIAGVSWYVVDRRAKMHAAPPGAAPARP